MSETSERIERPNHPKIVSFTEDGLDTYKHLPIIQMSETPDSQPKLVVSRMLSAPSNNQREENPMEKGREEFTLDELNEGLEWLGFQTTDNLDAEQIKRLAKIGITLANFSSFVKSQDSQAF